MKIFRKYKHIEFQHTIGKTDIFSRMFHGYYEIYTLLSGNVEYVSDDTRQKLLPNQIVIIPPGKYHQFVVTDNIDTYERLVLNIYPEIFKKNVLKNSLSKKELLSFPVSDRIIKNLLYLKESVSKVSEEDFSYILPAIATDIIFLIKNKTDTGISNTGSLRPLSLKLMSYINEHYTESLDLKKLSSETHFSVSSLCHIFKEDFGISIKKYIIQKRMNSAHLDLQNGENPEYVCMKYGFSNYSTFYRDYKKHFGIASSKTPVKNN